MNRRHLIRALAMGTCALFFSAIGASAIESETEPTLHVGETIRYDNGLKVAFLAVRNDSRCPMNARCIWAGDAEVVLWVKAGNQLARKVTIHTNLKPQTVVIPANVFPPGMIGIPKSYVIGIASLTPQPRTDRKILQSDYRLKLSISVAQ